MALEDLDLVVSPKVDDEVVLAHALVHRVDNLAVDGFTDLLGGIRRAEARGGEFRVPIADGERGDHDLAVGVHIARTGCPLIVDTRRRLDANSK